MPDKGLAPVEIAVSATFLGEENPAPGFGCRAGAASSGILSIP